MSQLFSKIKVGNSKRSTFDLSHHQVTTSDFGYIIPICYRDLLPNDDVVVNPSIFCRLTPTAAPFYGSIKTRVHHFAVPYRLLFPSWDSFITQSQSSVHTPPYFTAGALADLINKDRQFNPGQGIVKRGTYTRLMSNLGLNPLSITGLNIYDRISALPFLAYYRIWLDYFMDANLYDHPTEVASFIDKIKNGQNLDDFVELFIQSKFCCFKKDYFTTAKQNPQDGNPSIVGVDLASSTTNPGLAPGSGATLAAFNSNGVNKPYVSGLSSTANSLIGQFTVEALRAATAAQRYSERNNYVGTKLINRILAHFGIEPTPERLDMAEFLGGGTLPSNVMDVTSHWSSTDDASTYGLGAQAGKAWIKGSGGHVRYHAKEHCIFMSVMSIIPDTAYYQGISRFWTKGVYGDALDFYTPEFENLGYQEVLNKEVYVPSESDQHDFYQTYDGDQVFGYVPRFAEYKTQQDV